MFGDYTFKIVVTFPRCQWVNSQKCHGVWIFMLLPCQHGPHSLLTNLAPGRYGSNFKGTLFKLIIQNSSLSIWSEIVLVWMPQSLANDKSTIVQVMVWCHQATSHYLNQCWPRSMTPYGVTRRQWVNFQLASYCPRSPKPFWKMTFRKHIQNSIQFQFWLQNKWVAK